MAAPCGSAASVFAPGRKFRRLSRAPTAVKGSTSRPIEVPVTDLDDVPAIDPDRVIEPATEVPVIHLDNEPAIEVPVIEVPAIEVPAIDPNATRCDWYGRRLEGQPLMPSDWEYWDDSNLRPWVFWPPQSNQWIVATRLQLTPNTVVDQARASRAVPAEYLNEGRAQERRARGEPLNRSRAASSGLKRTREA